MKIEVRSISVRPVSGTGKLLALADVSLTWEEMSIEIRAIRVEAVGHMGTGGTRVCMPVDRDGRAILILPPELSDAVAEVVLAAGIEAGTLKTRSGTDSGALKGEKALATIQEMAACYIEGILQVQPDGPYRIAGWSAGGIIAYEVAHQLINQGQRVEFLGIIDSVIDQKQMSRDSGGPVTSLGDIFAARDTRGLKEYMASRFDPEQYEAGSGEADNFDELVDRLVKYKNVSGLSDYQILKALVVTECIVDDACENYIAPRLDTQVTLFTAVGESRHDLRNGWEALLAPEHLRVEPVEGTHISMMDQPHITGFGIAFSEALNRSMIAKGSDL